MPLGWLRKQIEGASHFRIVEDLYHSSACTGLVFTILALPLVWY